MTQGAVINLRRDRIARGLSERKAASEIGVSASSVRRAEAGESVRLDVAHKIATFYGHGLFDAFPEFEEQAA